MSVDDDENDEGDASGGTENGGFLRSFFHALFGTKAGSSEALRRQRTKESRTPEFPATTTTTHADDNYRIYDIVEVDGVFAEIVEFRRANHIFYRVRLNGKFVTGSIWASDDARRRALRILFRRASRQANQRRGDSGESSSVDNPLDTSNNLENGSGHKSP